MWSAGRPTSRSRAQSQHLSSPPKSATTSLSSSVSRSRSSRTIVPEAKLHSGRTSILWTISSRTLIGKRRLTTCKACQVIKARTWWWEAGGPTPTGVALRSYLASELWARRIRTRLTVRRNLASFWMDNLTTTWVAAVQYKSHWSLPLVASGRGRRRTLR